MAQCLVVPPTSPRWWWSLYVYGYIYIYKLYLHYIYIYVLLNFTSSWDFVIFREYWISRSRCNIWCSVRAPLGHLWTFKKKTALRGNAYLKKNAGWTSFGLIMFPTASDRFRLFPTVSDRFIFSERLIRPISFMEGWSSANPCKPWRLSFLVPPMCAYTAPNIASWP